MKKEVLNVRRREDGRVFQAIPQIVNLNFDNKYVLRYNIGINGYNEWSFIEAIYSNDEFNDRYEVVKFNKDTKFWEVA